MTYSGTPKITVQPSNTQPPSASNRRIYLALAGGALVALVGGASFKLIQSNSVDAVSQPEGDALVELENTSGSVAGDLSSATFESPFLSASPNFRLADPSLLQSTSSQARVDAIAAGRPDPFAPLVSPSRVAARPQPVTVPEALPPVGVVTAQPLPVVPVAATQSLPPMPQALPLPILPTPILPGGFAQSEGDFAVAPTASPVFQSLVEQVTVSGVVQIGSQASAIVTEPGNSVGRRVSQGDTVAGGRIRVKSIDMSGSEPVVVLTYDGRDYLRTVSSAAMVGSL
jgi:hypothetical protein